METSSSSSSLNREIEDDDKYEDDGHCKGMQMGVDDAPVDMIILLRSSPPREGA
jgi:hypothetical protein